MRLCKMLGRRQMPSHGERLLYKPEPDKLPLALQDHNHPVRYRNISIYELRD